MVTRHTHLFKFRRGQQSVHTLNKSLFRILQHNLSMHSYCREMAQAVDGGHSVAYTDLTHCCTFVNEGVKKKKTKSEGNLF